MHRFQIRLIHGENKVKSADIPRLNLLGAGGQLDTFIAGGGLHPGIRGSANVPVSGASGMDNYLIFKALIVYQGLKHTFR
jgi:hypothetical protein